MLILSNEDVSSVLSSYNASHIHHNINILAATLTSRDILLPTRQSFNHPSPSSSTTLIMPTFSPDSSSIKIVSLDNSPTSSRTSPQGSLLLFSEDGSLDAVLNSSEITAFRTALGSMIPLVIRFFPSVKNDDINLVPLDEVLVFGAGLQAEWALKLLLELCCNHKTIPKAITIVNRTSSRAQSLIDKIESWYVSKILPTVKEVPMFRSYTTDTSNLESLVASADTIFCCTPSHEALFPASYLKTKEASQKTRFISAIGSYTPEMHEVAAELLDDRNMDFVIVLDNKEACLLEAGEITALKKLSSEHTFFEVGQEWIEASVTTNTKFLTHNIFYKSVGTGAMDLAIAQELVKVAREGPQKTGTEISNF